MPTEIHCPKCASVNVIFSKKRSIHVCEDCGHEFAPPKTVESKRLFISYGRKDAEGLAERLESDLKAAGYEVWRDRDQIRAGTDYMKKIEDGLRSTQLVVALLSPHAVRRGTMDGSIDGVCLDEISFARFESPKRILPVMVSKCDVPICIYRLDYVDLTSWQSREENYRAGLQRILDGIAAALRGETQYRKWEAYLQPLDVADFLADKRKGFVGREWLFDHVDSWLETNLEEPALLIKGDPGIGKSAFVAQWMLLNPKQRVLACYCCQTSTPITLQPAQFIRTLAAMLASRLPAYAAQLDDPADDRVRKALTEDACVRDPASALHEGIVIPLHAVHAPPQGSCCIVVDALDEALLFQGKPNIVDLLASRMGRLPAWLKVVATTRNEPGVIKRLDGLRAKELDAQDPHNRSDLAKYLSVRLAQPKMAELLRTSGKSLANVTGELLDKSDGNFLYASLALDGLSRGVYSFAKLSALPPGLQGIYAHAFEARFASHRGYKAASVLLSLLLAAKEALPREIMGRAAAMDEAALDKPLRMLGAFLHQTDGAYRLFHRSLAEWLENPSASEDYAVTAKAGEKRLAEVGWQEFREKTSAIGTYWRRHLADHLAATERYSDLAHLLADSDLMEAAWQKDRQHDWMRHWHHLINRQSPAKIYRTAVGEMGSRAVPPIQIAAYCERVSWLLRELEMLPAAAEFAEQAVQLKRAVLSPQSVELADSLFMLAEVHRVNRDLVRGKPLYEEVLAIYRSVYSEVSAPVAKVYYSLTVLYNKSGHFKEALEYNRKTVEIREQLQPRDDAALGDAVNDTGVILQEMGSTDEVLPYYERAAQLFENAYPDGHPELATVLGNIARRHKHDGNLEKAVTYCERAYKMAKRFRLEHGTHCRELRIELINMYSRLGRQEEMLLLQAEARDALAAAVMFHEQTAGADHQDTIEAVNHLGVMLANDGDYAKAEPWLRRVLQARESTNGKDHPETLAAASNLVAVFLATGRAREAMPLQQRMLDAEEIKSGNEHPDFIRALNQHAYGLRKAGLVAEAEPFDRRAAETSTKVLGETNPTALHRRNNLVLTLILLGKLDEARGILAQNAQTKAPRHENLTPRIPFLQWVAERLAEKATEDGGQKTMSGPQNPVSRTADSASPSTICRLPSAISLSRLKSHFAREPLPVLSGIMIPWDLGYFIDALQPKLGQQDADLLRALVTVLNSRCEVPPPPDLSAKVDALNAFPSWRDAVPQPLE